MSMDGLIKTWRQRIGVAVDYPLHLPTDVERAMVAEIAELRAAMPCADNRQVIVIGGQRLAKSTFLDLQHEAARYRWLRDKADKMIGTAAPMVASLDPSGQMVALIDGEDLDAAVDVAMARPSARKLKTKRTGSNQ
jgi:hypothetical protein